MDKKNTLLLTVIAIATLLVAVVGATFAYFSAQVDSSKNTTMNVTTSSEDTLTYGSFKPLYIVATQTNFANTAEHAEEQVGSQKGIATGKVEYRKGGSSTKDYCYTAKLTVSANTFKYATYDDTLFGATNKDQDKPSSGDQHAPELLLKLTRDRKTTDSQGESGKIEYVGKLPTTGAGIEYKTLTQTRKVCLQEGSNGAITNCEDSVTLKGYDITEFTSVIDIPTADGGSELKHKLSAHNENETVTDEWTAELVFVNYDWDQQYNVGKVFTGTLDFASVDCDGD